MQILIFNVSLFYLRTDMRLLKYTMKCSHFYRTGTVFSLNTNKSICLNIIFLELQQKTFTMLENFQIVFVCKGNATKQSFGVFAVDFKMY